MLSTPPPEILFETTDFAALRRHKHEIELVRENPYKIGFRWLLALSFIASGTLHFLKTPLYMSIIPPWLPDPERLVYISGFFEILGAMGVLIPLVRRPAGYGLMVLALAVFPANVQMMLNYLHSEGMTLFTLLLMLRLPLQIVIILWINWCTKAPRPSLEKPD